MYATDIDVTLPSREESAQAFNTYVAFVQVGDAYGMPNGPVARVGRPGRR